MFYSLLNNSNIIINAYYILDLYKPYLRILHHVPWHCKKNNSSYEKYIEEKLKFVYIRVKYEKMY